MSKNSETSLYRRLLGNRAFMLLWGGGSISTIGDMFFNLAVMWVVYTASHSMLQTALIQVVYHLDRVLLGPIAGSIADRWDRKRLLVLTNVLSAGVALALAAQIYVQGHLSLIAVFITIILLNTLATFSSPAQYSLMPEVVGPELLAGASGLLSAASNAANFLGTALAGVVIGAVGSAWAVGADGVSFLVASLCIGAARLPVRTPVPAEASANRPSILQDTREGWRAIADRPIIKSLVWLGVLINVASFLGPLWPGPDAASC